jgi:hypothetical protein
METSLFKFKTGVNLSIGTNVISASDEVGEDKIDAKNIDSFNYEEFAIPKVSIWAPSSILVVFGFLLLFAFGDSGSAALWMGLTLVVIGFLLFIVTAIDAAMEMNLVLKILTSVWSEKGYAVTIGNMSGNNILFYTELSELPTIKSVGETVEELKVYLSSQNAAIQSQQPNVVTSSLDELPKLAKFRDDGVITEEEFNLKKKQLLGL